MFDMDLFRIEKKISIFAGEYYIFSNKIIIINQRDKPCLGS